jgi:hypothetical protein
MADQDFVLYLRSFSNDAALSRTPAHQLGVRLRSRRTEEEQLAEAVRAIGKLIAVGRPDERLPHLGAARGYLPDDDWQETVRRLLMTARLVLISIGCGPGLMWEIARATELVPPVRLVLLIPADSRGYTNFCASGRTYFPRGLPEYSGHKAYDGFDNVVRAAIYFEPDWAPRIVSFAGKHARRNGFSQLESAFVYQLKPVYERLNAPWPGIRYWTPRHMSATKRQVRKTIRNTLIGTIIIVAIIILLKQ